VQNVTDSYGNTLRNPDGSLYRNDSFRISWAASFLFSDLRIDIPVNVTSLNPPNLRTVNVTTNKLGRNGTLLYQVSAGSPYGPFQVTLQAEALNWRGQLLGERTSAQPFTVVQYSPYFKEFTYMDYNFENSSSYERPFVTLVRYDGNRPGYTYAGDANTRPFDALNSTGERAMVNDFSFSTEGWNLTLSAGGWYPFNFTKYGSVPMQYSSSSPPKPASGGSGWEVCVFAQIPWETKGGWQPPSTDCSPYGWPGAYPATVTAYFPNGTKIGTAQTDVNGIARFPGLRYSGGCTANCSTYRFVASSPGFGNSSVTTTLTPALVTLEPLANERFSVAFGLPHGATWCIGLDPADLNGVTSKCSQGSYIWFTISDYVDYDGIVSCSAGCTSYSTLFGFKDKVVYWRLGFGDGDVEFVCTTTDTPVQPHVFTWGERTMKWYFRAPVNASDVPRGTPERAAAYFDKYTPTGTAYFNLTETARSNQFAGGDYELFNSTYRYEPIFYNGNLTFTAVDQYGRPDTQVNVTVTAFNPNPLDPCLTHQVVSIFGNDSSILGLFGKDLYEANAMVQVLKPSTVSLGVWQYMINQTNLEQDGEPPAAIEVAVQGHGHAFTYAFPNAFSLYNVSIPTQVGQKTVYWSNLAAYTLGQSTQFRSLPLAFNFSTPAPYVIWSGPPNGVGAFLPIATEPGSYAAYYPFLYGASNTVVVNLIGGGASELSEVQGPTVHTIIFINPPSGGATEFWVRAGNGTTGPLLFSAPLLNNMDPPAPSGFEGSASFTWAPYQNGTVTVGIVNSFGVNVPVGYLQVTAPVANQPSIGYAFLWVFLAICAVFVLLGRFVNRHRKKEPEAEDSSLIFAVHSAPT
jgi:hypothetical protein